MIVPFIICNSSGEIIRAGTCPDNMVTIQAEVGESAFELLGDIPTEYIPDLATPVVTQRPIPNISTDKLTYLADGVDSVTISGIPVGSVIDVTSDQNVVHLAPITMTDTTLIVRSKDVGKSTYKINLFPNQEVVIVLEATS